MLEIALAPDSPHELLPLAEHQPVEFTCAAVAGAQLTLTIDGVLLEPFLRPGEQIWRWHWNPGPAVGLRQLALTIAQPEAAGRYEWPLRIAPRKIDAQRYLVLLDDIQRIAYRLAVELSGAAAEGAGLTRAAPWQHSPAEAYYALLEQRLAALERAVRRIAASPREQLRRTEARTPLGQASELSPAAISQIARSPLEPAPPEAAAELQAALRPGGGVLPSSVHAQHTQPSADTYEHRLLKRLLALLAARARHAGALAARELALLAGDQADTTRARRAAQIAAGCAQANRTLAELRALPFLADVQPLAAFRGATPLLQRDAAYREVYHTWQALRQMPMLAVESPLFTLPIAALPQLYEAWCALRVAAALLDAGGTLRSQALIAAHEHGPDELEHRLGLSEHTPLVELTRGDWTIALRYQPRYRPTRDQETGRPGDRETGRHGDTETGGEGDTISANLPAALSPGPSVSHLGSLDRYTHVPDLAIELRCGDAPAQLVVLDAKYRLDAEGRGVPPDALADAYTYLGAIGWGGRRTVLGSLLLFPGTGGPELFPSGVGAVPLLPGQGSALAEVLANYLPS